MPRMWTSWRGTPSSYTFSMRLNNINTMWYKHSMRDDQAKNKLTFDNIAFDAGSSVTNFSTNVDGRLTFGSMDQTRTARIKVGTPYKLTFIPKETISNTAGLFYTVLADAVDGNGKKINLIVE